MQRKADRIFWKPDGYSALDVIDAFISVAEAERKEPSFFLARARARESLAVIRGKASDSSAIELSFRRLCSSFDRAIEIRGR